MLNNKLTCLASWRLIGQSDGPPPDHRVWADADAWEQPHIVFQYRDPNLTALLCFLLQPLIDFFLLVGLNKQLF